MRIWIGPSDRQFRRPGVNTKQSSSGFVADGDRTLTPVTMAQLLAHDSSPSRASDHFVVRWPAAKSCSRIDDRRSGSTREYFPRPPGVNANFVSGARQTGLRPFLPSRASPREILGIRARIGAVFYKYFDTFVVDQNLIPQPFDYSSFPVPTGFQITDPTAPFYIPPEGITNGEISQPYNVKGGKMYGVELAAAIPFGDFIPLLNGFGMRASVHTMSRTILIQAVPRLTCRAIRDGS